MKTRPAGAVERVLLDAALGCGGHRDPDAITGCRNRRKIKPGGLWITLKTRNLERVLMLENPDFAQLGPAQYYGARTGQS
jgi:hypothetical protein